VAPRPEPAARPAAPPAGTEGLDPAFALDRYLFQQRMLTVSEKYEIQDEEGSPVLFVERPAHALRNGLALIAGLLAGLLAGGLVFGLAMAVLPDEPPPAVVAVVVTLAVVAGFLALAFTASFLEEKRHIGFYRDDTKAERLLEVQQDQKLAWFTPTFTVTDEGGRPIAHVHKNLIADILRKKWVVRRPDGGVILVAKEDSVLRAILRRFVSKLFLLNFILCRGETDDVIGKFDRKFTIRDRYVLDLTPDRARILDRRIALAIGVLLDTGERR
jgi:uncharacterized protein YxjI